MSDCTDIACHSCGAVPNQLCVTTHGSPKSTCPQRLANYEPVSVDCAQCGAGPGQPCIGKPCEKTGIPHAERVGAHRKLLDEQRKGADSCLKVGCNYCGVPAGALCKRTERVIDGGFRDRAVPPHKWRVAMARQLTSAKPAEGEGPKHDAGKDPWDLLPWLAVGEVVKVLEFGREKYSAESWREVPNGRRRYFAAMCRHAVGWLRGEVDEETGLSHLAHLACNALFLLEKEMGGVVPAVFGEIDVEGIDIAEGKPPRTDPLRERLEDEIKMLTKNLDLQLAGGHRHDLECRRQLLKRMLGEE